MAPKQEQHRTDSPQRVKSAELHVGGELASPGAYRAIESGEETRLTEPDFLPARHDTRPLVYVRLPSRGALPVSSPLTPDAERVCEGICANCTRARAT